MLAGLAAFTLLAILGYATIGRHPDLIAGNPRAQLAYGTAFVFFARGQVIVAAAVLLIMFALRTRLAWAPAAAAIYATSLASELLGTTRGVPFGPYHYTDALGWKWFGHVPLLIPLSWFLMAAPSFAIAGALVRSTTARVLVASMVLLTWDLALDPAMSFATKYWVWGESGPYYGMPLLNLFGWYVTGLVLMGILALLRAERWLAAVPLTRLATFFLVNLALPLGMCVAAGLYWAVLACAVPLALCATALRRHRSFVAVAPMESVA
jgi:putative membrane protein